MNAVRLLEHFERIAEAPDAVPRLRRFILDLAVRGKLVEQDPNDEPASELLKRIQAEKARLVKNGKIRNQPLQPFLDAASMPFLAPKHWAWLQLDGIGVLSGGMTPSKNRTDFWDGDINWFSPKDIKSDELVDSELKITAAGIAETGLQLYPPGCLFMVARSGILKRTFPVSINRVEATANQDLKVLTPFLKGLERFLQVMFRGMTSFILSALVKTGTTVQSLKYEEFESQPFPLPPLAEQQRIVAKVYELMALCDRLEAAQTERENWRDRLVAVSLNRLNNGADAESFREHARFHLHQLPRLTTRSEHIQQLRQTILNLAFRGQLVPQDPDDEPAFELFRRIQAEKKRCIEEGSLKKDKTAWDGLPKEPPYELPPNWIWARLQDVFEISRGGSPRPAGDPRFFGGQIPWITVREITKDGEKYLTHTESGLTEEGATRSRFIDPGDLLLTNSGATLGVPKISRIRACMNDGVAVLRLFHSVALNDFAYFYLQSQTAAFRNVNQGMGQPNLNTPIIAGWFFPLPPFAEQERIVAKIEEFLALCNRLEEQLAAIQTQRRQLLDATLRSLLLKISEHAS